MSSKKILSALALAITGASATQWQLAETYDKTNFFDKFDFFSKDDPTFGHVNYRNREDATKLGLIGVEGNDVFMRPDTSSTVGDEGRSSVRIESKKAYDHGLFIARFSKVPTPTCGVWPAFWTYGDPWVEVGEVDIIEQWHDRIWNQPAFHTGRSSQFGECTIDQADMRASVLTNNCDNYFNSPPKQYEYQGCTVNDDSGPWGSSSEAGVYAMEWTSEFLKLYSFTGGNVPTNIDSENPDTASWGQPMMMVKNDKCDIDEHFARQKLVFNINFCGNPAQNDEYWVDESQCARKTGYATCKEYVGESPGDFEDAYYKIQDIRVFTEGDAKPTGEGEPTAEPTGDTEPTAEPTGDAEPTAEPTACDSYECEESTGTETESPEPTACDSYECEQSSSAESSSPEPTEDCDDEEPKPTSPCNGDNCPEEPTDTESSSPEPTEGCHGYECDETTASESNGPEPTSPCDSGNCPEPTETESSGPEPTEDCDDEEPKPTSPCNGESCPNPTASGSDVEPEPTSPCDGENCPEPTATGSDTPEPTGCSGPDCPQEPTSIESQSPEPTEDECEEEPVPSDDCYGYDCPVPTNGPKPTESKSPESEEPTGCSGVDCPEVPVESSSPVFEGEDGCRGAECPDFPDYPEEPVDFSPGAKEPEESSYPEPEEPAPECFGSGCPDYPISNGTDTGGHVQTGAGVRAGASLALVSLVAVFAF